MKPEISNQLRPIWSRYFTLDWKFGVALILLICGTRFALMLQTSVTGNYSTIAYIMVLYALTPFIFLNKNGRRAATIKRPTNYYWLPVGFTMGLAFAVVLGFLGEALYGNSPSNWYAYIGGTNASLDSGSIPHSDFIIYTAIALLSSMTFSPVGEELFFRGLLQSAFANSLGSRWAAVVSSAAFALTHLSHFGIVYLSGIWHLLPIPALIWVIGMFLLSLLFYFCRERSGSIWGAILSHSGFNLGMMGYIFFIL